MAASGAKSRGIHRTRAGSDAECAMQGASFQFVGLKVSCDRRSLSQL